MAKNAEKVNIRRNMFDWAQVAVKSIISVILIFTFFTRVISVKGESMINTLQDHDRIVISSFLYTPKHGDIIVFTKPDYVNSRGKIEPMIKRVIGMSGDTIDFIYTDSGSYELKVKYKNADDYVTLDEPYIAEPMTALQPGQTYPLTVPDGQLFVMGDNRNRSTDSRVLGCIDKRSVIGHLIIRLWPDFGSVY